MYTFVIRISEVDLNALRYLLCVGIVSVFRSQIVKDFVNHDGFLVLNLLGKFHPHNSNIHSTGKHVTGLVIQVQPPFFILNSAEHEIYPAHKC